MPELNQGDRVRHSDYGAGTLVAKLILNQARVVFDATPGLSRTLHRSELEALEESAVGGPRPGPEPAPPRPAPIESAPSLLVESAGEGPGHGIDEPAAPLPALASRQVPDTTRPTCSLDQSTAWQTLEALRLGVVPVIGVQDYTIGRESELNDIENLLGEGHGCRVVWGDYGAGKTHMLQAAEQIALDRGFATARINLDPTEQSLHHPLRLYRRIVDSIRTRDQINAGFEDIFEALADSPAHHDPFGDHASRFFTPYLHALRKGDVEQIGWLRDYVRGDYVDADDVNYVLNQMGWRGRRVLRMSDYRTYGRMYIHLVGTLASWCADAGTRGLVLLFDEVERVDTLTTDNQKYAFEVLRHYAAVTMRPEDLNYDPDSLYKGGHSVHRAIPLLYRENQPLISVFALTPLEEIQEAFRSLTTPGKYDLELPPLGSDRLAELLDRIAAVYERAYRGCSLTRKTRDRVADQIRQSISEGHDSFRDAVRAAVFLFDQERLTPAVRQPA